VERGEEIKTGQRAIRRREGRKERGDKTAQQHDFTMEGARARQSSKSGRKLEQNTGWDEKDEKKKEEGTVYFGDR